MLARALVLGAAVVATLALPAPAARADLLSVSGQAQVAHDGDGPLGGGGVGVRASAQVLMVEGYFDYLSDLDGRSVRRTIVGVRGGASAWKLSLTGRLGLGPIRIVDDPSGPGSASRSGVAARAGAAVEVDLRYRMRLGLAYDVEARYLFSGSDLPFAREAPDDVGAGSTGLVYLKVHFGL